MTLWLHIKYDSDRVKENAPFKKALEGDAAFDLYNASDATLTIPPHTVLNVPAGIGIKLPDNYCGLIVARSSTLGKRLIVVTGLIDSGYTGPIYTRVWHPNFDNMCRPILIEPWERLSQMMILPVPYLIVQPVDELPKTIRGNNGFGSTGR